MMWLVKTFLSQASPRARQGRLFSGGAKRSSFLEHSLVIPEAQGSTEESRPQRVPATMAEPQSLLTDHHVTRTSHSTQTIPDDADDTVFVYMLGFLPTDKLKKWVVWPHLVWLLALQLSDREWNNYLMQGIGARPLYVVLEANSSFFVSVPCIYSFDKPLHMHSLKRCRARAGKAMRGRKSGHEVDQPAFPRSLRSDCQNL